MKSIIVAMMAFAFIFQGAFASTPEFEKRFQLVRENGKLMAIRDQSLDMNFSLQTYVQFLKERLMGHQEMMASKANWKSEVESLFMDDMMKSDDKSNERLKLLIDSLEQLGALDIEAVFSHPEFKAVLTQFESKLREAFLRLDPQVIAAPQTSNFFYTKRVTYQVVKWALDFAKDRLSSVPILNTASYIIVEAERMIRERRTFHQNILLHYFESSSAEELGMSEEEMNAVLSSVYESRIPWFAFWESRAAGERWNRYGVDKFYTDFRYASSNLRRYRRAYDRVGERYNFAFQEIEHEGERMIVNLVNSNYLFDGSPSVAYSFDRPERLAMKRSLLVLGGLGVSFLPFPQFLKDMAETVIKSFYDEHRITEGALFAFFETERNREALEILKLQYLNPFDSFLILE